MAHTGGAFQRLDVKQEAPAQLLVSAWSRSVDDDSADKVLVPSVDYSLYADITYMDGTHVWGYNLPFKPAASHGWHQVYGVLPATKPIDSVVLVCMYRWRTGAVLFDDVCVSSLASGVCTIHL
eukprot:scaffold2200_cov413-Prasinococcus_capsulatus_cf.AAC.36